MNDGKVLEMEYLYLYLIISFSPSLSIGTQDSDLFAMIERIQVNIDCT